MTQAEITAFVRESNLIERISRDPTDAEIAATAEFFNLVALNIETVSALQSVYAPGKPLRCYLGMNVRVGRYYPPGGGREIEHELMKLCRRVSRPRSTPWREHVAFERLHPVMDGNGRTGRAIWAWHMLKIGEDPFALPFLHRFYYQTLEVSW